MSFLSLLIEAVDPLTELLKLRFKEEGNKTETYCHGLEMQAAAGKTGS